MTDHSAPGSDNAVATRHDGLDRRTLLTGAASALVAAAAAVAHAAPAEAAQSPAPATASGPLVVVTDRGPVVETTGGRVRGARMRDIHTFTRKQSSLGTPSSHSNMNASSSNAHPARGPCGATGP